MIDFHFLRPWWLLLIIPLLIMGFILWRQTPRLHAWNEICDRHLLDHLLQKKGTRHRMTALIFILLSVLFAIISTAGPTWYQLPAPAYKLIQPRVVVLDLSSDMMETDLSPDRLSRAKFKLRDLLHRKNIGQMGLIVFTGEPFVVSPLTDDGETIASLLPTLTPDIVPVAGQKLSTALDEAEKLIQQAGYKQGQILVLTADTPSPDAMETAQHLAEKGIFSSILPMKAGADLSPLFQRFADSGKGQLLVYSSDSTDLDQWLSADNNKNLALSANDDIPLWRDEGRWFLIPTLVFLLPIFRRGWLQRISI